LTDCTLASRATTIRPKHRSRDWSAYDKAKVASGDFTLFVDRCLLAPPPANGRRGRDQLYSDQLVLGALALKRLFRLDYRSLEGFVSALARLAGHRGPTPDYSSFCKRARRLDVPVPRLPSGPVTLLLDSTGLKVVGPGEWRRFRDESAQRRYLKLHLAVDESDGRLLGHLLTDSSGYGSGDSTAGTKLLLRLVAQGARFRGVYADGAYDGQGPRRAAHGGGGAAIIPPRARARTATSQRGKGPPLAGWQRERNEQIRACREDREQWKEAAGYHRRSLAETAMSRWKTLLGPGLAARGREQQRVEAAVSVWLLNQLLPAGPI
jgi:Transposase DDE domain